MKHYRLVLLLLAAGYIVLGISRIGFNVDILKLLPAGLPQVEGLSLYLRNFANPDELIVTVEADEAEAASSASQAVAKALREAPGIVREVIDEAPLERNPAQLSEMLAWMLVNQSPERTAQIADRLSPSRAAKTVKESLEEIGTTFSPGNMLLIGADPYRFSSTLPTNVLSGNAGQAGFTSPDGSFHAIYVTPPHSFGSYRETAQWLERITAVCTKAVRGMPVKLGYTGEPAFVAEISIVMERDMVASAIGTLAIITLLFWVCYRRVSPLKWLLLLLQLVFLLTLATAGFLLHSLTAIGAGFASVMIGLSVDYGYFVHHRSLIHRGDARTLRRDCLNNILWTSGTTAAAFFSLNLSSLPGLSQFGNMVGIGVVIGAFVMLGIFAPLAVRLRGKEELSAPLPKALGDPKGSFTRIGELVAGAVVLLLLGTLLWKGFPRADFSPSSLRPRDISAQKALDDLSKRLGGDRDARLNLVVSGKSEEEVLTRLQGLQGKLESARDHGDLVSFLSPLSFWPDRKAQRENLALLGMLEPESPRLKRTLQENGFTEEAFILDGSVLAQTGVWRATDPSFWPDNDSSRWILGRMVRHANGSFLALGFAEAVPGHEESVINSLRGEGIHAVNWVMLGRELQGLMPGEIVRISLGLIVLILVILAFGLKSLRALALFLVVTLLVLACLAGAMSLFGMSCGFFNLAAVLLLLGTGTDYSILLLLALRRNGGNVPLARRELGLVIFLCSASAAAGFGSLAWAGNPGLADLGKTCALGLAIDAMISYFLLPRAWSLIFPLGPTGHSSLAD